MVILRSHVQKSTILCIINDLIGPRSKKGRQDKVFLIDNKTTLVSHFPLDDINTVLALLFNRPVPSPRVPCLRPRIQSHQFLEPHDRVFCSSRIHQKFSPNEQTGRDIVQYLIFFFLPTRRERGQFFFERDRLAAVCRNAPCDHVLEPRSVTFARKVPCQTHEFLRGKSVGRNDFPFRRKNSTDIRNTSTVLRKSRNGNQQEYERKKYLGHMIPIHDATAIRQPHRPLL